MVSHVTSTSCSCSLTCKRIIINAALSVPRRFPQVRISVPKNIPDSLLEGLRIGDSYANATVKVEQEQQSSSMWTLQMYAVLEAVSDRVEMHQNIKEQRENWNSLLLNSINMMTLTATTMSGISAAGAGHDNSVFGLNLASTLLFSATTGMLVLMNKIQPSQLTEEQRNATKLFKQLQNQIQTLLAIGNPTEDDVRDAIEKVLALDKAFPVPLLGAMLEKFPNSFAPAVWWPKNRGNKQRKQSKTELNGWNEELETELRDILDVIKSKDVEDYERLGNIALKVNKVLAISGPLLTGIAAIGAAHGGSWAATAAAASGALATTVNTLEHGGQVGMVFEMYRNCAGFFSLVEETIESTLDESDVERRENGNLFEMKMGLKLGRSLSQLKDLAKKSRYSRFDGSPVEEFASRLF